ncbi:MAG TPA: hypothetical protein DDW85_06005 [Porphyromonadaceae bacterium]|nr:hypothetical protein [Porphyromonadaceae bacterium]
MRGKKSQKGKKSKKTKKKVADNDFFTQFAVETDIFLEKNPYPDWVFDYREGQLMKLSPNLKKVCRNLKALNVEFKIKYPVKIFDKWKFADIFIPSKKTVIVLLSSYKEFKEVCCKTPDRVKFFEDRFCVVEMYEYNAGDIDYLTDALMKQ